MHEVKTESTLAPADNENNTELEKEAKLEEKIRKERKERNRDRKIPAASQQERGGKLAKKASYHLVRKSGGD